MSFRFFDFYSYLPPRTSRLRTVNMAILSKILVVAALASSVLAQHGASAAKEMGPVAFMWPPDRPWGAADDNTPPCGSAVGVTNRTKFPSVNGVISLVTQDESWQVQVAISYMNNPTKNSDFTTIINASAIAEIDDGHMCFPIPNPKSEDYIRPGRNATLQISYTSDFEEHRNQTFYACADIMFVPVESFTYTVPCFNATIGQNNITTISGSNTTSSAAASSGGSSAPSGGVIAGIVIGVVVAVAAIAGLGLYAWRWKQRALRLRASEAAVRNIKWEESSASTRDSAFKPGHDVVLTELRK